MPSNMFTLSFDMDNAAFDAEDAPEECARILRRVVYRLDAGDTHGLVADVNGNTVGSWKITGRR